MLHLEFDVTVCVVDATLLLVNDTAGPPFGVVTLTRT
jgi:hypothetical protein